MQNEFVMLAFTKVLVDSLNKYFGSVAEIDVCFFLTACQFARPKLSSFPAQHRHHAIAVQLMRSPEKCLMVLDELVSEGRCGATDCLFCR